MIIELKKFGEILSSRQTGREALLAFSPSLPKANEEKIIIDFTGVATFTPSWGDEFLTPLQKKYQNNLFLKNTTNPSVKIVIEFLEKINQMKFQIEK
jgi:hypothetical protein